MSAATFEQAAHAAELVGLAVYARAVLVRACEHDPAVVSVAVRVFDTVDARGVVEAEFLNQSGQAVGGFAL